MIKPKDITIIVPHLGETREQEYAFDQCYTSLKETAPDVKIIVVKNGEACPHPHDIRIIEQGQCKAVNVGVVITNTSWIMVSNDDMIYPPEWFEKLTKGLDHHSDIICVSPKLVEPRIGSPTFEVYFCGGADGDFDKQKFLDFTAQYYKEDNVVCKGFNLPFLIRRELWDLVGGYDINYDPWGSNGDSDLEYKIKLAGIQPYQNTDCIVYHFSQTSGTFHPDNQKYWQDNWDYFIEKWGFPRTDKGIWEANFEMPTINQGRIFTPWWENFYDRRN